MEIYFLRHGETAWNREKRIQGSSSWIDLTDEGVRLAEAARRGMLAQKISFDRIYTSPYRRACHTAEIIADGFGLAPIPDPRLREISFGPYEGSCYKDGQFADDNIRACFTDPPRYVPKDGGESFDDAAARVRSFLDDELAPLSGSLRRVLAVAHGGILRTVLRIAGQLQLSDFWKAPQPNCCVHIIDLTDGRIALKHRALTF